MDQNVNDRREKALNQLSPHKEAMERIAATGVPLLHLDTELVIGCLHFVLAEIELRTPLMKSDGDMGAPRAPISSQDQEGVALTYEPQGFTCRPQYDTSPYPDLGDSLNCDTSPPPPFDED
jgi:hypothetical protein